MGFKVERLQEVIRFKVAMILQRDLADPRMGIITITRVKLAKDLTQCTIYWSQLGDEKSRSRCEHMLEDARGFIQREVAGSLKTRVTPHLRFEYDASIERSARIAGILREELGSTEGNQTPAPGENPADGEGDDAADD